MKSKPSESLFSSLINPTLPSGLTSYDGLDSASPDA